MSEGYRPARACYQTDEEVVRVSDEALDGMWRIRWRSESGRSEVLSTANLGRAQDTVLDLLRRRVDFQVIVHGRDAQAK